MGPFTLEETIRREQRARVRAEARQEELDFLYPQRARTPTSNFRRNVVRDIPQGESTPLIYNAPSPFTESAVRGNVQGVAVARGGKRMTFRQINLPRRVAGNIVTPEPNLQPTMDETNRQRNEFWRQNIPHTWYTHYPNQQQFNTWAGEMRHHMREKFNSDDAMPPEDLITGEGILAKIEHYHTTQPKPAPQQPNSQTFQQAESTADMDTYDPILGIKRPALFSPDAQPNAVPFRGSHLHPIPIGDPSERTIQTPDAARFRRANPNPDAWNNPRQPPNQFTFDFVTQPPLSGGHEETKQNDPSRLPPLMPEVGAESDNNPIQASAPMPITPIQTELLEPQIIAANPVDDIVGQLNNVMVSHPNDMDVEPNPRRGFRLRSQAVRQQLQQRRKRSIFPTNQMDVEPREWRPDDYVAGNPEYMDVEPQLEIKQPEDKTVRYPIQPSAPYQATTTAIVPARGRMRGGRVRTMGTTTKKKKAAGKRKKKK